METKPDGLTAKQREFARLVACGHTQADAYRRAYNVVRAKPETVARNASKLAHNTYVATRIRELLREARIEDILTVGEHMRGVLNDLEVARAQENMTAVAALDRVVAQILGMTSERFVLGAEKSESDDELVARLSGGDEHKAAMLRSIIGKDSFE